METYLLASVSAISWGTVVASSAGGRLDGVSASFFFKDFFRRCKQKSMRHRMTISATNPPTVPPAMAATFDFFELPPDADSVAEGRERVADLAVKVGLSV